MSKNNYVVHKEWIKDADFEVLILEYPIEELEDKLAFLAYKKGMITKSLYEDFVIANCLANINQFLAHIKSSLDPAVLLAVRNEILDCIFKVNPNLVPDNLVINRNHVVKVKDKKGPKDDERLLTDNKYWKNSYYEDLLGETDKAQEESKTSKHKKGLPKELKSMEDLSFEKVKQWWTRIGTYISVKKFKEEDMATILNKKYFYNKTSFQTYIVSVCVIDSEDLFVTLDDMGIPGRVSPPILMAEIYNLCEKVNPFLTFDNAKEYVEDLNEDQDEQDKPSPRRASNRMSSHARQKDKKKKVHKKKFKDVSKNELLNLGTAMKVFVVGQDDAIDNIVEAVQRASVGLKDPNKPIGSFLFAGRTGIGKCVEEGTLIFSEDGIKTIDSFCKGNKIDELEKNVYGIDGVNSTSYIYKEGIKPGRRICTNFGYNLGGSLAHPIVTINEEGLLVFKKFHELTTDDYVAVQYNQDYFSKSNKELSFNFVEKAYGHNVIRHAVPNVMSEELAYYIGLLIGDGSLSTYGNIGFTNKDKQLVNSFYVLTEKLFGITPKLSSGKHGYYFSSVYVYEFLKAACGISMTLSTEKTIPASILESTKECITSFIKGLMDTDGYFEKTGAVGITLSSEELIHQLQVVLLNFGIISKVRHRLVKYKEGFNDAWELTIRSKFLHTYMKDIGFELGYKKDGFNPFMSTRTFNPNKDLIPNIHNAIYSLVSQYTLNRKFHRAYMGYYKGYRKPSRAKLKEILTEVKRIAGDNFVYDKKFKHLENLSNSYIFWDKVSFIEETNLNLYDFTVPETHTFTSNGLISHNTLTTKVLADELIKDRNSLVTIDCSEYSADHEYAKLIGCFVPGTKVKMSDGTEKNIEEIEIGESVISHTGVSRKVEQVHEYDQDGEMVSLQMANTNVPVITTKTHEILAIKHARCDKGEKRGYKVCKSTCKQEYCVDPPYENYELGWLPASELEVNDIVAYPRYKPTGEYPAILDMADYIDDLTNYKYDEEFIWAQEHVKVPRYINVNEDLARLAGYYVSEGGIGSSGKALNFTFNSKELDYITEIVKLIRKIFGRDVRIKIQDRTEESSYRIWAYSEIVCNFMSSLFGYNTYVKRLPSWFKNTPDSMIKGFLETAVFGDGCTVIPRRMDYSTVSSSLFTMMEILFRRLGYITYKSVEPRSKKNPEHKDRYRLYIGGNQIERLNEDFNFGIDLSEMKSTNIKRKAWIDEDYVYFQLKDVSKIDYTGKVYDLSVEKDVSYITEFIVHNSPSGYVGHEQGGILTNALMENPFSVVVFDEVEKASHKVHELMLQILEEGRLTDGKGQKVSFKDCVIIMTSNVGVDEVEEVKKTVGFGDVAKLTNERKTKAIDKAIKKKFKPEFINRIDAIVHFNNLKKNDYMRIIDLELYKLNENLRANDTEYKTLVLEFDKKLKDFIYKEGIDEDYGARPLKRCIEKEISNNLASALLKEEISVDSKVNISVKGNKVSFKFELVKEEKSENDPEGDTELILDPEVLGKESLS